MDPRKALSAAQAIAGQLPVARRRACTSPARPRKAPTAFPHNEERTSRFPYGLHATAHRAGCDRAQRVADRGVPVQCERRSGCTCWVCNVRCRRLGSGVVSAERPLLDLPDDPDLAVVARALELHGFAGEVWDAGWRLAYLSSEYRTLVSAGRRQADVAGVGEHLFSAASVTARETWPTGPTFESFRESVRDRWHRVGDGGRRGAQIAGAVPFQREIRTVLR